MRLAAALAALLVTMAGCVSQERATRAAGAGPGEVAEGLNNTTASALPVVQVYWRHDFTRGDQTRYVDIEPNSTLEYYNVYFAVMPYPDAPAGACATLFAKITIKDPTGAVFDEISSSPTQVGASTGGAGVCGTQKSGRYDEGIPFGPAGRWTAEFTGVGLAWGFVIMNSEADDAPR